MKFLVLLLFIILLPKNSDATMYTNPEKLVLEVQVEEEDKGTKGLQHSLEVEIKWFEGGKGQAGPLELG